MYFIGKNCEEGVSVSAFSQKMAGLAFLFKLTGVEDVTKSFLVCMALGIIGGAQVGGLRRLVSFGMLAVWSDCLHRVCFTPF